MIEITSHRSLEFVAVAKEAEQELPDILHVAAGHRFIFVQGEATLQFAAVPLNMLGAKSEADYLVAVQWSEKAHQECAKYGAPNFSGNTRATKFTSRMVRQSGISTRSGLRALLRQRHSEQRGVPLHSRRGRGATGGRPH